MGEFYREKIAIVTGASSGIGLETARLLSKRGAKVVLAARRKDLIHCYAKELGNAIAIETDVTQDGSVKNLVTQTMQQWGRIDILINNAGELLYKPIRDCSEKELRNIMEVNFFAAVRCANEVLPILKKQGGGFIANIASIAGRIGFPQLGYYSSSKFALVAYSETLRQEVRQDGIFVTTICPGTVNTPMTQAILEQAYSKGKNIYPISAQTVAKKILYAIEHKKAEVFVPQTTYILYCLHFFFPKFTEWLAWKFRASDPKTFSSSKEI